MTDHTDFINVRWNSTHLKSTLLSGFTQMLERKHLVDVTLSCDNIRIECHRLILSICSPYLADLIAKNSSPNLILCLVGIKSWQLHAIVSFMYRGVIENVTHNQLMELVEAAKQLRIHGLADYALCSRTMNQGETLLEDGRSNASENSERVREAQLLARHKSRMSELGYPGPISRNHDVESSSETLSNHTGAENDDENINVEDYDYSDWQQNHLSGDASIDSSPPPAPVKREVDVDATTSLNGSDGFPRNKTTTRVNEGDGSAALAGSTSSYTVQTGNSSGTNAAKKIKLGRNPKGRSLLRKTGPPSRDGEDADSAGIPPSEQKTRVLSRSNKGISAAALSQSTAQNSEGNAENYWHSYQAVVLRNYPNLAIYPTQAPRSAYINSAEYEREQMIQRLMYATYLIIYGITVNQAAEFCGLSVSDLTDFMKNHNVPVPSPKPEQDNVPSSTAQASEVDPPDIQEETRNIYREFCERNLVAHMNTNHGPGNSQT